jgi:hypothetical protein
VSLVADDALESGLNETNKEPAANGRLGRRRVRRVSRVGVLEMGKLVTHVVREVFHGGRGQRGGGWLVTSTNLSSPLRAL